MRGNMKILILGGNGYVGSKFYQTIQNKSTVKSVDLCLFQKDLGYSEKINFNSVKIDEYDVIYCFAGHSSVPMSECSPTRSWINNVDYFSNLCEKLTSKQKLIYASSASIYGIGFNTSNEDSPISLQYINHYDMQKKIVELIANSHIKKGKNIIGLRFGTINGASPNTRSELMLNSMMKSALEKNLVFAKNLRIRRAILGINDLSRLLNELLYKDIECGQYNVASFNSNVNDLLMTVVHMTGAKINLLGDDKLAYDFELDTNKIQKALNFKFLDTPYSICQELQAKYKELNFDERNDDRNFKDYL